ncbi:hypothetical protein ACTFIR_010251 [Dictyostelium discoideum]
MIINSNIKITLEERSNKLEQSHIEIGLLIGQESEISEQQTYVLGLFPTPLNISNTDNNNNNKPINIDSISSIDKEWILEYCHQVNIMLYGGIDIVGIYMIIPDSDTLNEKNNESFIMKLLKSIHTIINSKSLQFISYSKKTGLINGKATNSTQLYRLKSTEIKVVNNLENEFLSLHCILPIDIKLKSKNGMISFENVKKDIIEIFENQLFKESTILIENEFVSGNEMISQQFKSKSKLNIDLLINQLDSISTSSLEFNFNNNNNNTHCIAYIHQLEQIKTAFKFIKKDIIKSVESRFDLLFNEISNNNNQDNIKLSKESPILELPRRVNIQWLSNNISICDYLSSNGTIDDCYKIINDLLQITSPKINSIESSKNNNNNNNTKNNNNNNNNNNSKLSNKKENNEIKENKDTQSNLTNKSSTSQQQQTKQTNNSYLIIIISVLVLMVAFYFKFFV